MRTPWPCLLDDAVVRADPSTHRFAHVPGGVIPDQRQDRDAQRRQFGAAPLQELGGDGADWASLDKAQPDRFVLAGTAYEQAIAGQRFGIGIGFGDRLFHQAQRAILLGPSMEVRLRQAAPPDLVGEAQRPVRLRCRQRDQAVAAPFFRAYAGSGLVIHCLARFQPMPSRLRVRRTVSPLTRVLVSPCTQLTSAANSSVHTLVG